MSRTESNDPPEEAALEASSSKRITALDGLRGLAVLGVLLFHADHLVGWYLGVDAFFVPSGFLITGLLLAEVHRSGGVALGAFWARRARRLLPALFLVLLGAAVFAIFFAEPSEMARIRADAIATVAYVAYWHSIVSAQSYADFFNAPSPLQHTWSLAIEEQFYVFWPLVVVGLVAVASRRALHTAKAVFWFCIASFAITVGWTVFLAHRGASIDRLYYGTDTRMPAILIGASLAAWVSWRGTTTTRRGRIALETVAVVAAVALAIAWASTDFETRGLYLYAGLALLGVLVAVVIMAAAHPERGPVARALAAPPLVWLGLISYGLYLWHWPVYAVLTEARVGVSGWPLTALRIAVSLALAVASYFLVEAPIRHGALHGWVARVATPSVAFAVVAIIVVVTATAGTSARASAQSVQLPEDGAASAAATQSRLAELAPTPTATANRPSRVLVVGDSVAWSLGAGMEDVAAESNGMVLNAARVGCVLANGLAGMRAPNFDGSRSTFQPDPCDADWDRVLASYEPDLVVLLLGGRAPLSEWNINDR